MNSITNKPHFLKPCCLMLLCNVSLYLYGAETEKTYDFKYGFQDKDTLRYEIHQFDSTQYNYQGEIHSDTVLQQKLQILSIQELPKQKSFSVTVKLDSKTVKHKSNLDQDSGYNFLFNSDPEMQEIILSLDEKGKPLDKKTYYVPALIPLPDHPARLNQTWQFAFQDPDQKIDFFKGMTTGTGRCLFYDVQETPSDTIAIFIAEIESRTEGKIKLFRFNNSIEYDYLKKQSSTHFIYFDAIKDHIKKVVATMETERWIKNGHQYSKTVSKSKLYLNLIEKK